MNESGFSQSNEEAVIERSVVHESAIEQLGFTIVPNAVIYNATLSIPARFVYGLLKSFAWRGDNCFPGQRKLAEILGVTDRSVRSYMAELIDVGLVTSERRGMGESNLYTLSFLTERNSASGLIGTELPDKTGNELPTKKTKEEKKTKYENKLEEVTGNDVPLPPGSVYKHLEAERRERDGERGPTDEERAEALAAFRALRSEVKL